MDPAGHEDPRYGFPDKVTAFETGLADQSFLQPVKFIDVIIDAKVKAGMFVSKGILPPDHVFRSR